MSWFRSDPIDHRRVVAVHEAGHLIAARRSRARGARARLWTTGRGYRGLAWVRSWRGSDEAYAVHVLAGSAAARLLTGHAGLDGSDDLDTARSVCADTGAAFDDIQRRADRLVRARRGEIVRAADVLYRNGEIR